MAPSVVATEILMASSATLAPPKFQTLEDVLNRVGHVPANRILLHPTPGTATEADLFDQKIIGVRVCELVDGILVEKPMGFKDDGIGIWIICLLWEYLRENNHGHLSGAQGPIKLKLNLVRLPDVTFIRWDSVEDTSIITNPDGPSLEAVPDLVVEVLSPGNTKKEMSIKLAEYARAGVPLVWYVDPKKKVVTVYPEGKIAKSKVLGVDGNLDGGDVMPGLTLSVQRIFEGQNPGPRRSSKKDPR